MHMLFLITYKVSPENGYGFLRPGLITGVGNGIFWSEIGSGFGNAGGTPLPKIPRSVCRQLIHFQSGNDHQQLFAQLEIYSNGLVLSTDMK